MSYSRKLRKIGASGAKSTRFIAGLIAEGARKDSIDVSYVIMSFGNPAMSTMIVPRIKALVTLFGAFAISLAAPLAAAPVKSVDPNSAIGTVQTAAVSKAPAAQPPAQPATSSENLDQDLVKGEGAQSEAASSPVADAANPAAAATTAQQGATFRRDDLIGAAEGVFGKGAKGLGELMEKILKDQGEPNGYIAGREASGAFVVGFRYGSGTLMHKVEGQRAVYWTGPSLGFDVGGDAAKVFVLVYNLYDSQDLYKRFAQVEGRAYFVGGLSATYLRRGDIALIPVRLGVGVRLGANIGYMKFSEKSRWLPF